MWIANLIAFLVLGAILLVFVSSFWDYGAECLWKRFQVPFGVSFILALLFLCLSLLREKDGTEGTVFTPERSVSENAEKRGPELIRPPLPWYYESHALVIGVSNYSDEKWPTLQGVEIDVPMVTKELENQGFKVESAMDLGAFAFEERIKKFIGQYGRHQENRLLFYFSGHGYSDGTPPSLAKQPMGYFVLGDTPHPKRDIQDFRNAAFSMVRVREYAGKIDAKHALFIFDSCFSGALFAVEPMRGSAPPESVQEKTSKPTRQFITSGRADERVPDQSIFRMFFIEALQTPVADTNCDGYVTGTELGEFLYEKVTNKSEENRQPQHPQYGALQGEELQGDFVFRLAQESPPEKCQGQATQEDKSSKTPDSDPVVVGTTIGKHALHVRKSDIQRVVELIRQLPQASSSSQPTEPQVRDLADKLGLLESRKVNPQLIFLSGYLSSWVESGLTLDELKMQFAARRAVLDAADRDDVKIKDQGTFSFVAGRVIAELPSDLTVSSETEVGPESSTPAPVSETRLTMSAFQSNNYIEGKVEGIPAEEYEKYQILVYVLTDKWYLHPWAKNKEGMGFSTIQGDGTWRISTVWRGHQAYRVAFLLTERTLEPPSVIPVEQGDRNKPLLAAIPAKAHLIIKAPGGI